MQFPSRNDAGRGGWWWHRAVGLLMLLWSSILGSTVPLTAQTITQAEYYLDSPDPGFGAASPITISSPAADMSGLSFTYNVSSLSAGFHRLNVRTKDANGQWSLATRRTFYYEPLAATAANVTKVEYFVDTDPGFGLATDVPITAGTDVTGVTFAPSVGSLGTGFHTLGVRSRDANGQWSLTTRRSFYYEPAASTAANITKAEYFIDTDPGFGSATDIPVASPGTDVSGLAFTYDVSSLSTGFHSLGVRTKDANGQWSLTTRRVFYYEPAAVAAVNVTKVEYFIDTDPGFGSATDVPITAGLDVAGVAISIPVGSLSTGFHNLQVRSRDANGKWSLTTVRPFYFEPLTAAAPNINKIEYFFDTDPGFGLATDVPVASPAADLPGFGFLADASALTDGTHRIFVRTRDANGKWSLVTNRSFVKNGCASSANFTASLPSTSYNYGGSSNGLAETAFNADPASPNTSNTFYGYAGSLLQADMGTAQTISEVRYKLTPGSSGNHTVLIQMGASIGGSFTTVDTYSANLVAGTTTSIARTLATPVSGRVLRIVLSAAPNYVVVSGAGSYYFNCAGPTITSFTPAGGATGTSVVITGTNFTGATGVTFNGTAAPGFVVNSGTQITVSAPAGGSTGQICVTTPGGTACSAASYAYPPTIATGTVSPTSFCSTTFISVPFSTNTTAYQAGNQFKFQISDANGVFTANSRLYGISSSQNASGGVLTDTVAFRTPAGTGYRVRVVATNPATTGTDNGVNLTVRPTPVATASATQTTVPYNGTIQLQAGPAAQNSYQWYVQYTAGGTSYVGSGATLSISNAQPSQSGLYYVYVQNSGGCQDSASVRVTVQPNAQPILTMSQFSYTGCTGGSLNIGFAVTGNTFAGGNVITAQLSDASGSFASPTSIGSVNFSGQGSGSVAVTFPANTPTGSGYRVRLVGSSPSVTSQTDNGSNISLSDLTAVAATANAPLLPGQTLQLDVTGAPVGSSFAWSGPNGFSSTQRNPQVTNTTTANSGTYQVVVTYASCTATRTVGVLVGCSNGPNLAANLPAANYTQSSTYNGSAQAAFNGGSWYDAFAGTGIITARFTSPQQVGAVRTTVFKTYNQNLPSYQAELSFDGGTTWQSTGPAVQAQGFDGTVFTWALPGGVRTGVTAIRLTQTVSGAAGCAWINVAVLDDACAPTIVSFTPAGGPAGTVVGITGTGFTGATQVQFGGVAASSFVVNSATSITATAPATGVSGPLTVVTPNGSASSSTSYVYPPVLTLTTFGGSLCGGQQRTLSFTSSAGSFATGNVLTAQLSDASGSFAAATTIGTLTGFTGPGTGSVTATIPTGVTSGTGYRIRLVASDPATSSNDNGSNLSINPVPTAAILTSNSPVATGGTVTLTAQAVAGATYVWSVPGFGNVNTGSTPTLSYNNATTSNSGTYTLTVTLGACPATTTAQVTVNPAAPTLTLNSNGARQTCAGNVFSLSFTVDGSGLTAGGTVSAQLSDENGSFAAPTTIGSVSFTGTGTNTVSVTVPASAATGSLYRVRLVSTNPALTSAESGLWSITNLTGVTASSNSPVAAGGTILLTSGGVPNGATIQWSGPNGFVSSQPNPQIQNAAQANAGSYTLNVTQGGCTVERTITVTIGQPVASVTTGQFSGSYCPGSVLSVPFTTQGVFGAGNVFTALLSDASGSFAAPTSIGTLSLSGTGVSGSISATIPAGAAVGSNYRIRVDASAPATVSSNDNGSALAVQAVSYTWTGGFSTNWFDARNWSCGQVPTASSNVIIGPGSYYPIVTGTGAVVNNITVSSTASFQVSSTFTIYGNVVSNGTWLTGGSYVFAGSGTQTVGGSSAVYFGGVTINGTSTLSLGTGIYVSGNWVNNGGFVGGTYFVNFNGTVAQYISGGSTSFYSVVVSNPVSVNLQTNITVLGNWTVNSGATFYGTGYVTTFNGSSNQVIGGGGTINFGGLTVLNTTGGVTLSSGIGLGGAFVNNGSFAVGLQSVAFNGTALQTIGGSTQTTFYNVVINNTVGVNLVSNIYVLGDWINNGQFAASIYTVYFNGTAAQIIGGTQETRFTNVTFQNPVSVTLHQNIYVLGGFVNTGVFYGYYLTGGVPTGHFVRFGGSGAQVITANATTYFWHFYVDNAAGVSLASNIYVAGNYYLYSGSFAPGTYTVYFNGLGGYVQTVGGYTALSFYGWNIVSGTEVRILQNVTWLGSFVNNGVFYGYDLVGGVYTGYTSVFGGSVAQVVGGSGTYNFWHVTWNNLVSVTLQTNVYVLGNWINSGGFAHGGYTVFFNGTVAQTIGGAVNTIFYHVSVGNLVSVSLLQPITVLGNWLGTGVFLAGTNLVYFNGAAAQTITASADTRFYNIRFNNPTSVTLLSNLYLTGNWLNDGGFVAGGYGVYFVGSALQTIAGSALTQFHHVTIGTGANVRIDRAITVLGDWTTNGTFLPNGYVVTFAGTVNQIIGGTAALIPFYGLTITNNVSVTLAHDIRVRGGWVNNGVFVPATYTVYFDGTVAQVIGGTAVTTFHHLSIINTVGVTLGGPIFVTGNFVNDGLFAVAGYLVTFNGTVAQTIGGSVVTAFHGVTFNNAVGVSLLNDVRVRGDFRNLAIFAAGGYTVYFDGSVAQGIYCPSGTLNFHHVTFANLAGVTLNHGIFVTGNWLNNGGFAAGGQLVTFSGSVLQTIGGSVATVFHHLTLASGADVRIDRAITLLGNWLNQGATFAANGFAVLFNGTVAQTIGGTALTVFHHLTLNNLVGVSLDYDVDLTGNFVNTGIFCGCGKKTRFIGTTAQTITCTSGNTRFHDLTFDNAAGVTLLDAIGVTGNWVNNAGFLANGQLVLFNGTVLQTIGGTALSNFWNIQITNAVNVQLLHDIVVGGYWLNSGIFSGNGYLVTFNGSTQQTITTTGSTAKTTFHHVTWANPVGCVLGGDIYVTGNWLCNGPFSPATYTVYFTGTVAQTLGGSAQIRFYGLNVQNTVGLTCNGPVYLYGNLTNGGLVNVGTYPWYCVGTSAQTLGGTTTTPLRFYDLFIQNGSGVGLGSAYGVTHMLTLTSGNLASDGFLTLHSNASGTAMVVNPVGGGLVTGRSTMERFITGVATTGYRHYSSPMQLGTATVNEFADDLPVFELNPAYNTQGNTVTPFPTFYQYDETRLNASNNFFDRGWMVPTAADNLVPMRGYSAMTDPTTTVDISGVLQNGTVSIPLSRGGQSGSGWNLLGNPYPAPIDWDLVPAVTGMDKAMYVFVPSGRYTGSYRSYVNGVGQNGGSKDLAAMQGFFVRATAASATVNLTNAVRHTSYLSPAFDRQAPTTSGNPATAPKPLLRLEARNAQGQADETVLYFDQHAGAGYQANYDAYKVQLNGNGRPSLWSKTATDALSINGLPSLATAGVVPLGLRVSQNGPHTLVLTALQNLPAGTQVLLEDRLLGRRQDLALDSVYAFTMHPDSTRQRFFLWFQPRVTSTSPAQLQASLSLYPNPTHGVVTLTVAGLKEQQGTVKTEVLNTVGQVVRTLSLPVRQGVITQELNLRELPTGVYTVRLHTNGGTVVRRLVKD